MTFDSPTFNLLVYVKDRALAIFLLVLGVCTTSVMLLSLGINASGIFTIEATFALVFLIYFIYDYLRRRRFWAQACELSESLDRVSHLSSMLDDPTFLEGRLAFDMIEILTASFNSEIQEIKDEQNDYRQYIELWIHEAKAPIAAASLIAQRTSAASELMAEIERIEHQITTALFYARATSSKFDYSIRQINLLSVVRDAAKQNARYLINKGVSVDFDVDKSITVQADKQWLVFMLTQVMLNSAQYGASHIIFRVLPSTFDVQGGDIALQVIDDGDGIPAQDIKSVFERSYVGENGRRYGKSTGMGLYLVALMCSRCGISVSLTSEEGVGTTVSFGFPQDLTLRNLLMTNS